MRVVDLKEMLEIERITKEEFGFSESLIMENVGLRGADFIEKAFLDDHNFGEIILLAGMGNNAADGFAIARNLANRGHRVRAFVLFPNETPRDEVLIQAKRAKRFGVRVNEIRNVDELSSYLSQSQNEYLMIDAIVGTGFRMPLSNYLFDVVNLVNHYATVMVSVDIPSGVTGDKGESSSTAIQADYTLSIGLPKIGHYVNDGARLTGELFVIDGGFPHSSLEGGDKFCLNIEHFSDVVGHRSKFDHKNRFGHTLVLGGSRGMTGALIMASESCLKVGTGLVTAATWRDNYGELCSRITPEIMTGQIPTHKDEVESVLLDLDHYDCVVMGPGLGLRESTRENVVNLLTHFAGPVVLDADAIKSLSLKEDANLLAKRKYPTIMTPHVGEFAKFIGKTVEDVESDPISYLKQVVDQANCIVVLKSYCTFIGLPNGETYINYMPNDGMASGGSGDVLAGIIGGLLAQNPIEQMTSTLFVDKKKMYQSVLFGVYIHSLAGKHACEALGARAMSAGSIIDYLTDAFKEIDELIG